MPSGLYYAAHCSNRGDAQNDRMALSAARRKLGVTPRGIKTEIEQAASIWNAARASMRAPLSESGIYAAMRLNLALALKIHLRNR